MCVSLVVSFNLLNALLYLTGAVMYWLSMRIHKTGVVNSIPPSVTIKTPFLQKAMGIIS